MEPLDRTRYTPLYEAQNAPRYERQDLIRRYEEDHNCSLVVVTGPIFGWSVAFFEELLQNAERKKDLHVVLVTPGGDGETALRLVRAAQQRCRELVVVLPDQAKSAGTIFTLGAHKIVMGPTSDLGPIDPQFQLPGQTMLVSAKDIIGAVEQASAQVQSAPETYPLWASMLASVSAIMVQQARSALSRSDAMLREALASNPDRIPEQVGALYDCLHEKLITEPASHAAVFGPRDALAAGLPVVQLDPDDPQWRDIWRLWTRYLALPANLAIYEGSRASQIHPVNG